MTQEEFLSHTQQFAQNYTILFTNIEDTKSSKRDFSLVKTFIDNVIQYVIQYKKELIC